MSILPKKNEIRREEYRQAKKANGGLWGYFFVKICIKISRLWLPTRRLRLFLYQIFNNIYPPGINEEEAEFPLHEYSSLNSLFTRGVKSKHRPISRGKYELLCPCDGTIQDVGCIEQGQIITLKGIKYLPESLLPQVKMKTFDGWNYVITYLSLTDCHRVFSPQDGRIENIIHVPGARLHVTPSFQNPEFPVYTLNERMIFIFSTTIGLCILVMIAGSDVGNITLPALPDFKPVGYSITNKNLRSPIPVNRGEWFATFELGSTVILLFPPQDGRKYILVSPNEKVKYGQPIFS